MHNDTGLNEGTQEAIPYTLLPTNLLISLLYLFHNSDVIRTIWKGLKVQKQAKQEKRRN